MKKFFSFFLVFIFLALLTTTRAVAEVITNFDAQYQINSDGTINVIENITYDAQGVAHHGITREVKLTRTNDQGESFKVRASDISSSARLQDNSSPDKLNLRLGDPNSTFTGVKTFTINYTLSGALTYFSDHDELYWNVTGDNWNFPIEATTVRITLPENTTVNTTCFTGASGATSKNCQAITTANSATFSTGILSSGEGLTIVTGFPTGIAAKLQPAAPATGVSWGEILAALVGVIFYLFLPFAVVLGWLFWGRDPKVPSGPTAWFDPPKNVEGRSMLPAEVGLLTDESVDARDITATIVSLAIRGFLVIKKEKEEYIFTKTAPKNSAEQLTKFEQILYDGLFKDSDITTIKTIKTRFATSAEKAKQALYKLLTDQKYFAHNPDSVRKLFQGLGSLSLFMFNIFLGIVLLIFARHMPRKTLLGATKKAEAESLKRFLTSQERQLSFQEQNWYFFEKLLPYAVAFGVTKVWAERFKDLNVPTEVTWYQGQDFTNAYLFASSLDSFSHSAAAMTSTPYSSTRSSSGFSSGFSGGFSGGGGGGGGGGSW